VKAPNFRPPRRRELIVAITDRRTQLQPTHPRDHVLECKCVELVGRGRHRPNDHHRRQTDRDRYRDDEHHGLHVRLQLPRSPEQPHVEAEGDCRHGVVPSKGAPSTRLAGWIPGTSSPGHRATQRPPGHDPSSLRRKPGTSPRALGSGDRELVDHQRDRRLRSAQRARPVRIRRNARLPRLPRNPHHSPMNRDIEAPPTGLDRFPTAARLTVSSSVDQQPASGRTIAAQR
jgi:hypothetical protein